MIRPLLAGFLATFYFPLQAAWYADSQAIMGTNIRAEVWADSDSNGKRALALVMQEMERINQKMSPYIETSELSLINAEAHNNAVVVSSELFDLIKLSQGLSAETQGAFDITFASVGFLYDYRKGLKPDENDLLHRLDAVSYRHIKLNETDKSIRFTHPQTKIDLGGIAKGYAVENSLRLLKQAGVQHALVTAGGDTGLVGDRRGRPWMVGIRDPRNKDREAVVLPLEGISISTSGDYERYFEQDGERFHHILSPSTGKSVSEVQSVTIIGPRSTLNDALSTAVFVLGVNSGIDLINKTPGYDAIVMDKQRRLHYSKDITP